MIYAVIGALCSFTGMLQLCSGNQTPVWLPHIRKAPAFR